MGFFKEKYKKYKKESKDLAKYRAGLRMEVMKAQREAYRKETLKRACESARAKAREPTFKQKIKKLAQDLPK